MISQTVLILMFNIIIIIGMMYLLGTFDRPTKLFKKIVKKVRRKFYGI